MNYTIGIAIALTIAVLIYAARRSFGKASDNSTGTHIPHEPRDDLR